MESEREASPGPGEERADPPAKGRPAAPPPDRSGRRSRLVRPTWRVRLQRNPLAALGLPLAVLGNVAALSLVWELVESRLAPSPSAGTERILLALRILAVATVAGLVVYGWMRRLLRRSENACEELSGLLEEVIHDPAPAEARAPETGVMGSLMLLLGEESPGADRLRSRIVERERVFSLGQLTSGLSHEILNPLAGISSVVQMLGRSEVGRDLKEHFARIEENVDRISSIVRRLSELSRRDDERWALVNVERTLARILELVAHDARARNVEISFDPPTNLPCIRTIPGQLDQVFLNLLLNALDAMPDGGTITVRARENAGSILVRIRDTGVGIPPDVGQRIFSPFFSTKEPGRGTGMGLAVCYAVIRRLGGIIEFDSREGKGTVFTVIIPA